MNRSQILSMLTILKNAYPNFYKNISTKEAEEIVTLYEMMFKDDDANLVLIALKEVISTSEYPPAIATIKNKMYSLTHIEEETNMELWDKLLKAIRNGTYGSVEEFNKLPKVVKDYIGSPTRLQELASLDSSEVHTVIKGQFLKQIDIIKQRNKEIEKISPEVRQMLGGMNQKQIGE